MDGKETAIVSVGNIIWHSSDRKNNETSNPPHSDTTANYLLSALFMAGSDPFDLGGYIREDSPSKKPLSEENGIYMSFLPSKEGWSENYFSVIQLDAQGKLIECPVFVSGGSGYYVAYMMMLLCDIDGDGNPELITKWTFEYSPITVYKLIDGRPQEIFSASSGA